uniref:UPF0764 protein C16orf89 homolog n=2 Tax=Schistocephalus solidus TaxID=70667 RepID=A0A0X3PGC2_SCHSO
MVSWVSNYCKKTILSLCYFGGSVPFWVTQETCELEPITTQVYNMAMKHLKSKNLTSVRRLGFVLDIDWQPLFYRPPPLVKLVDVNQELTEKDSDICLENLKLDPCHVSKFCKAKFFTGLMSGYRLTHQVLYSYLLTKTECFFDDVMVISTIQSVNYMDFGRIACDRVKKEFESIRPLMFHNTSMRDLGLEQIFLCGSFGDLNMADPSLLSSILSWQDASGCFKSALSTPHTGFEMRNLLYERRMEDGCLTHLTTVAIGALIIYLRRFISNNPAYGNYLLYIQREEVDHINRFLPPLDSSPEIPVLESGLVAKPFASVPESLNGFELLCPVEPLYRKRLLTWSTSDAFLVFVTLPLLVLICIRVLRMIRSASAPPAARMVVA